ncbi:NAD+ synthase [Longimonas halophila]|uniref:Glutamine-dependent NAD(+) synthetase n=1 Tax=Longimonas halophila TaxID=1469170 RepID=A0A2H3P657_9BACT|nr:NAD+ synthase [Longimonas halophila]PEN06475.1 NAD+ synthase [Longimonas halophila]
MTLALAQINPTVGDLDGNCQRIVSYAEQAAEAGADLVAFPELCLTGYPPQDLLSNPLFIEAVQEAIAELASTIPAGIGVIVGAPLPNPDPEGRPLYNTALLLERGAAEATVRSKALLPTYDVFDEDRHFEPGPEAQVVSWRGMRIGLHVCEDMWNCNPNVPHRRYTRDPIAELAEQRPDFLLNISASPFSMGKAAEREALLESATTQHNVPFAFVNQVGANTEIVFDGNSRVYTASGTCAAAGTPFDEDLVVVDLDALTPTPPPARNDIADLHDALVLGIRDYYEKTGIFEKALVGLSGGIDSAVTCALATEALGPDRVLGVTMPSEISSEGSVTDSEQLARNLGIDFKEIPIAPAVDAFDHMLADTFSGTEPGVAEENIQSRSRGITLMALSNKFGHLLLSTGNKSEMAVGYVTLYGDTNGGVAVLSDVLKTKVYELANYINSKAGTDRIPQNTIDKPPSAELRPDQEDTDSLPEYAVLDTILARYVEEMEEAGTIIAETGYDPDLVHQVLRMVDQNEYKRRQAPPGIRVTDKAFGMGRRIPIVMNWDREAAQSAARPAA